MTKRFFKRKTDSVDSIENTSCREELIVEGAIADGIQRHVPATFNGDITLFLHQSKYAIDAAFHRFFISDWKKLIKGEIACHIFPGEHLSPKGDRSVQRIIGEKLNQLIDEKVVRK